MNLFLPGVIYGQNDRVRRTADNEENIIMLQNSDSFSRKAAKIFRDNYQLYILLLPALAATFIFIYIPIYGIQIAFKNFRLILGIVGSPWIGFVHFKRFIELPYFWPIIRNTLSITLYHLALFPLNLIIALMINEIRNRKFKKTVQMISYAPHFLSVVVLCGMVTLFLQRSNGIFNNIAELFGGTRSDLLGNAKAFAHIYVWSGVWQSIGWGTIIYLAALSNVSPELVEAAQIDGASRLKIIWHVNIPAILPTVIILFIMATGGILSLGYEKILLLQNPLNLESSRVISTYVYEIGILSGRYDYATAINLFNNFINVIVICIVNAISKKTSEVSIW